MDFSFLGTVTCHEVFRLTHKIHLIEENPKNIEFLRRRLMLKEENEDEGRDMAVPLNDDSTLDETQTAFPVIQN